MVTQMVSVSMNSTRPFVGRTPARCKCFAVGSQPHQKNYESGTAASVCDTATLGRRQTLLGLVSTFTALNLGIITSPPAVAKVGENKEPKIVNDPATLKTQLEAQYQQWSSGKFDAWLASQPETMKWQSSYNGVVVKSKGKAGAKQYFTMLNADLDVQAYKPLAIFVDNDGDEATVIVEASGTSRRTQQPFKTIFLHAYTIGPLGQILKFKETTDTALMAQLIPTSSPMAAAAPDAPQSNSTLLESQVTSAEAAVEPGSTARSA